VWAKPEPACADRREKKILTLKPEDAISWYKIEPTESDKILLQADSVLTQCQHGTSNYTTEEERGIINTHMCPTKGGISEILVQAYRYPLN
jgi:hypothetical protein